MNVSPERRAERRDEELSAYGICALLLIALVAVPLWMAFVDWINGAPK